MLEIKNLSKSFKNLYALDNIQLTIPPNCIFALLGPNGSGKTTLLKSLLGPVLPDNGSIVTLNKKADFFSHENKKKFVYMTQTPNFPPHLTPKEIILFIERIRNQPSPFKKEIIQELEINRFWEKPFGNLSGGMKQKINILQCFMFEFQIAFLDEPTSSLDPQISYYLKDFLKTLKKKGKTIIFTSHIMAEVEELADQMALMINGKIQLVNAPGKFIKETKSKNLEEALLQFWRKKDND